MTPSSLPEREPPMSDIGPKPMPTKQPKRRRERKQDKIKGMTYYQFMHSLQIKPCPYQRSVEPWNAHWFPPETIRRRKYI